MSIVGKDNNVRMNTMYYIGIDLGISEVKLLLMDEAGRIFITLY